MQRYISHLVFLSCLMLLTPLYASTQTLTTYYPAPQGQYKNMTVNGSLSFASGGGNPILSDNGGILQLTDSLGSEPLQSTALWTLSGGAISPAAGSGTNVSVGALTATGNATVGGTLGVTGNSTVGGTLGVTGATTLSSTLGVTGNATVGGTLGVTGNTTESGSLTVTGNTAVNGNTYVNAANGIYYCTNPNNPATCGQLMVALSNGNYYATYGP